jgi:hypothetical protein
MKPVFGISLMVMGVLMAATIGMSVGHGLGLLWDAITSHREPTVTIPPRANCSESGDVLPGQQWRFKRKRKGPWPSKEDMLPVTVVDVKDGWVRYDDWPAGKYTFSDGREEIQYFTQLYECVPPSP